MKAGNVLVSGRTIYFYDPDCAVCGDTADGIMVGENLPDADTTEGCRPLCETHREESNGDDWRQLEEI